MASGLMAVLLVGTLLGGGTAVGMTAMNGNMMHEAGDAGFGMGDMQHGMRHMWQNNYGEECQEHEWQHNQSSDGQEYQWQHNYSQECQEHQEHQWEHQHSEDGAEEQYRLREQHGMCGM